ncbi:hypothetical protein [Pseudomonas quasicaspiana]|uniref:hypothetical protein n=1 Tax=Pseudomonas quasicaspiana TaxID=2829821 RepID=UPI001E3DAB5E|nr:hypothetical protein [Pseudomonas quasicaspiana]MCD5970359.1 hypothetical protein [Pseudomonas quasicaspiana]
MNNCTLKRTMLTTSLFLALSGVNSSTVLAKPVDDPDTIQQANTLEGESDKESTAALTETTDVQITDLPDKINRVFDKLEGAGDVKYYSFTALRGQKVMINEVLQGAEVSYWKIEYNLAGNWQTVPKYESLITASLTVGQKVQIRVAHPTGVPIQPGKYFHIDFGSAPYAHNVRIETEGPTTGTYFWTSTFRERIMWATNIRDSTGQLLEGATVDFVINTDDQNPAEKVRSRRVTVTGGIVEYVSFPACNGRHMTTPFTEVNYGITTWQAAYNSGHWHVSVRGNPSTGISPVSIAQICSMKIIG